MFVWKNEAHKPQEIDEHNLTKLNQISTYWVYIFNTKKKKNNGQTWPALLSGNILNHLPLISYILDLSDDIFSISRCMARWSTITRIAHFKLLKFPPKYFCGDPIKQMCGCLPSPQCSVPTITADNSMCDALCLSHPILMRSHQNVY